MHVIEDFSSFPFERLSAETGTDALRQVLDSYDQALKSDLPTEARSTIARQQRALRQFYRPLALVRATD